MEQKHFSTKTIADCGIFAALAVILLLIGAYIPVLGTLVMFVWSIPVMIAILKDGIGAGVAVGVVTTVIGIVFVGVQSGLFYALSLVGFGLVYGICFLKKYSPGKTLLFGILAAALFTIASISFAGVLGSMDLTALLDSFESYMRDTYAAYEKAGLFNAVVSEGMTVQMYEDQLITIMKQILPAMFVIAAMVTAAANYFFAALILRKLKFDIRSLPKFRNWHMPWWIMWGLVVALLALVVGNFTDYEFLITLAKNICISYCPVMLIAGISFIRYLMVSTHLSGGVQVMIWIVAVMFLSVAFLFFVLIGAVDTVFDYRSSIEKRKLKIDGGNEK